MPTMLQSHQEDINRFSRLNTQKKELEEKKLRLTRELEDIEEAGNEVMLTDEERVPYGVGECFVRLTGDEVEARLEARTAKATAELERVAARLEAVVGEMAVLKKALYATFGNALYLEEE
jgi:chaperonin cofactor prefoldin